MRIVVNDVAATGGASLTVLESFYRHVHESDQRNEWVFLVGCDNILEESARIRTIALPAVKNSWPRRLWFDLISGRRLIRSLKPDVVFSMQNTYTYGVKCPQVIYVHQSLPFQRAMNFSVWRRDQRLLAIYKRAIGAIITQSIRRADHVVVQSQWLRGAIVEQVRIAPERVACIPPDLDELKAYVPETPPDRGAFFYPTTGHAYKNVGRVHEACRLLRQEGTSDFQVTITADTATLEPNIAAIGPISRVQSLEILARSTLIYPSLFESYGLPLAEARALGVLVLAADRPYAREVLEGYENAYYFDPISASRLAALMRRVITGEIMRSAPVRPGEGPHRCPPIAAWARVVQVLESYGDGRARRR